MNRLNKCINALVIFLYLFTFSLTAKEIHISGIVTDTDDRPLSGASISLIVNSKEFVTATRIDGRYDVKLPDLYSPFSGLFEVDAPFPNPFDNYTIIPVNIGADGDLLFSVYDLIGRKVYSVTYNSLESGSYRIIWNGTNQSGASLPAGYYIFHISFLGNSLSGKIVKAGVNYTPYFSSGIEKFFSTGISEGEPDEISFPIIVSVKKEHFHSLRLTDIVLSGDTILDFVLKPFINQPFKTTGQYISHFKTTDYLPVVLKGINLGSSPPGTFPGEIAYAVTPSMYERWIELMAESGFNAIRVYTLHPPVFYQKLAEYNYRHPDNPLFLFQGIWLDEIDNPRIPDEYDLILRSQAFKGSIREVIDCVHGNKDIPFRLGRSYGQYFTDISPWIAGYIIGREVMPQEVDSTNQFHSGGSTTWGGNFFSISSAEPTEVFVAAMLDETASYEWENYSCRRTLSFSSWPTLDPLIHPTEIYTDEDVASIDITKIIEIEGNSMLFASYHAYPYYPDFVNDDPLYRTYTDSCGPNSYLGYLTALKDHYVDIPLVIGEFGVPSSWGSAHESYSGMPHGGISEMQQGNNNVRLFKNILSTGCAGGFMFSWMDEWFKPTWIVQYMEAFGTKVNGNNVPTRQLWHNLMSSEQNFGLIAFDQLDLPAWKEYTRDVPGTTVSMIKARHDISFFYLDIQFSSIPSDGDTIMIAFDTYQKETGESVLPGGRNILNRSEFMLEAVKGEDTVLYHVTEAYDMFGLSPRFNLSDTIVQKFKSIVSDNCGWKLMRWITNGFDTAYFETGKLPAEESLTGFSNANRIAAVWQGSHLFIRLPWTMLYFHDPTQRKVINGAVTYDGGYNYEIQTTVSDGIAISVFYRDEVTNTLSRYTWSDYLVVPQTIERQKKSLQIISSELNKISGYFK